MSRRRLPAHASDASDARSRFQRQHLGFRQNLGTHLLSTGNSKCTSEHASQSQPESSPHCSLRSQSARMSRLKLASRHGWKRRFSLARRRMFGRSQLNPRYQGGFHFGMPLEDAAWHVHHAVPQSGDCRSRRSQETLHLSTQRRSPKTCCLKRWSSPSLPGWAGR